jgi:hypothetical protein
MGPIFTLRVVMKLQRVYEASLPNVSAAVKQHPPAHHEGRMDDKWSVHSLLLGSSSLANHGGYLSCFFFPVTTYLPTYLLITTLQAGC